MYYHHSLAKNATDKALTNWKHSLWSNNVISVDVYQTLAAQTFPSPDAMLFDPTNNHSIAIEFKPPTETKRGILTGLGQAIAYLSAASMSYLIAPKMIEGYDLSIYLRELYQSAIYEKLPLGLICYHDEESREVELIVDIAESISLAAAPSSQRHVGRYWAKHVDLPLHGLWTILDIAYQLPNMDSRVEAIWRKFWDDYLFPLPDRTTLDVHPTSILKHNGKPLCILDRVKRKLQKRVDEGLMNYVAAIEEIKEKIDPHASGDNYYKSIKKNYFPLIKHLMLWDDNGHLTEDGFLLHKIGKIHGPRSETFKNYFARVLLFNGKHLELILDVERLTRNKDFSTSSDAINEIQSVYTENGLYKPSPGAVTTGTGEFLKYERIMWGQLGFLDKINNSQFVPKHGFVFNWDKITKICSLE